MTVVPQGGGGMSRGGTGSLYDVLELILDRGLVIDEQNVCSVRLLGGLPLERFDERGCCDGCGTRFMR